MVRQSFPNFVSHTYIREIIKKKHDTVALVPKTEMSQSNFTMCILLICKEVWVTYKKDI